MPIGPVQIVVFGFPESEALSNLTDELQALRAAPGLRLLDLLSVSKDADGRIEIVEIHGAERDGVSAGLVSALTGIAEDTADAEPEPGDADVDEVWFVDEAIPAGTSATIALIEHTWAIGMRDRIRDSGGALLAEAWVHPSDLVSAGLVSAEQAERDLLF